MKTVTGLLVVLAGALWMNTAFASTIHIVAFGGSNTYGKNLTREEAYPAQLEAMLKAEGYDVVIKNEGVNGNTTGDELGRLDSAIPAGTDIVIFQPGGNDNTNKRKMVVSTKQNIETIVKRLLDRKIAVIFSGNDKRQEYVKDFNLLTIDEINKLADDDFQSDGQHLTPKGYHTVAGKMLPLVKQLIANKVTR